jgi:hypothetical protein
MDRSLFSLGHVFRRDHHIGFKAIKDQSTGIWTMLHHYGECFRHVFDFPLVELRDLLWGDWLDYNLVVVSLYGLEVLRLKDDETLEACYLKTVKQDWKRHLISEQLFYQI